jgi:hypothetical protein
MKNIMPFLLVCILCVCAGCSHPAKEVIPTNGRYYLDKAGSTSFIEVSESSKLLFSEIDFSEIEKNTYEKWAIGLVNQNSENANVPLTDEEKDLKIQSIRDEIDLDKQFSGHFSQFEFIEEAGEYGFTSAVNGSTLCLIVLYHPDDNSLTYNEHKYILK